MGLEEGSCQKATLCFRALVVHRLADCFLSFFGGMITMKMAVLLEQTLMVIMVIYIVTRKGGTA